MAHEVGRYHDSGRTLNALKLLGGLRGMGQTWYRPRDHCNRGVHMLVISDRLQMQLLLPPCAAMVYLWFGRNILISTSRYGVLTPSRTRMLWAGALSLLLFMYGVTFDRELRAFWLETPVIFVGIMAFILLVVGLGVLRLGRTSQAESTPTNRTADAVRIDAGQTGNPLHGQSPPSLGFQIRQWTVLIWAVLGIGGTFAAILWRLFRK